MTDISSDRFSHILQPIKELSENWNIDIASELEEYLDELEKVSFTFGGKENDETHNAMNFAEAAMLIQGSACVYSRKVEHLYNLVYQTLNVIFAKKKSKVEAEVMQESGVYSDTLTLTEELTELDEIEISDNIDLPSVVINRQLSLTDLNSYFNHDVLDVKIDEAMIANALTNSFDNDTEKSCLFKATTLSSGLVVLGNADKIQKENYTSQFPTLSSTNVFATPLPEKANRQSLRGVSLSGARREEDVFFAQSKESENDSTKQSLRIENDVNKILLDSINALEGFSLSDNENDNENVERPLEEEEQQIIRKPKENKAYTVAEWTSLDPYDDMKIINKPFKKGVTFSVPDFLSKLPFSEIEEQKKRSPRMKQPEIPSKLPLTFESLTSHSVKTVLPLHTHSLLKVGEDLSPNEVRFQVSNVKRNYIRFPTFVEFDSKCEAEMKRRNIERKRVSQFLEPSNQQRDSFFPIADPEEEEAVFENADFEDSEPEDHIQSLVSEENRTHPMEFESDNRANSLSRELEESLVNIATRSYDELLKEKVNAMHNQVSRYVTEQHLHKRVIEWHEYLQQILDIQERRENFDIVESSKTIIQTFKEIEDEGKLENGKASFSALVRGCEQWEVSRLFLASLQLVNSGLLTVENSSVTSLDFGHGQEDFAKIDWTQFDEQSFEEFEVSDESSSEDERRHDKDTNEIEEEEMEEEEEEEEEEEKEGSDESEEDKRKPKKKRANTTRRAGRGRGKRGRGRGKK